MPQDYTKAQLKIYHGYGHAQDLVLYGHVFRNTVKVNGDNRRPFQNMMDLFRLFTWRPLAGACVRLQWREQVFYSRAEQDGFFKFEWASVTDISYGWHEVTVTLLDEQQAIIRTVKGSIYVPRSTQYAFISDIDDTVLVSHSDTVFKRLKELLFRHPEKRKIFWGTAEHYRLLAGAHNEGESPNPFFYVSSSEWNLYDYLLRFFRHQQLPEGVFLLNQAKYWTRFFQSGKTGHNGKLMRIARILQVFPRQQFILLGDNSQMDPEIYAAIARRYPGKIIAIYIRNVQQEKAAQTRERLLAVIQDGVSVCIYNNSSEAIAHSRQTGLI